MSASKKEDRPTWSSAALFRGLSPDEVRIVGDAAEPLSLPAGEHLFHLGDEADSIYVVEAGAVTLTLPLTLRGEERQVAIDSEHPGDLVGWSGLVAPYRRTLGARAAAPSALVRFRREALEPIFREHPPIHLAVSQKLCEVIAKRLTLMEAVMLRDLEKWGSRIG